MDQFQPGDEVELRTTATATRGRVIALERGRAVVRWEHRFRVDDATTAEAPEDLQPASVPFLNPRDAGGEPVCPVCTRRFGPAQSAVRIGGCMVHVPCAEARPEVKAIVEPA